MSKPTRISLLFDHPGCPGDVTVDIELPLPDPVVESTEAIAERVRPACPICKQRTRYAGFRFVDEDNDEDDGT